MPTASSGRSSSRPTATPTASSCRSTRPPLSCWRQRSHKPATCHDPRPEPHEELMETSTPSLGKVLTMVLFALSCVGLLLYLWLSFGGEVPLNPRGYRF